MAEDEAVPGPDRPAPERAGALRGDFAETAAGADSNAETMIVELAGAVAEHKPFPALFPNLDLLHVPSAERAVSRALAVAGDRGSSLDRHGPNPALILRVLEWVFGDGPPLALRDTLRRRVVDHIRALAEPDGDWHWMWRVLAAACGSLRPTFALDAFGWMAPTNGGGWRPDQAHGDHGPARIAFVTRHASDATGLARNLARRGLRPVILSTSEDGFRQDGLVPILALDNERDVLPWLGAVDLLVQFDETSPSVWIEAKATVRLDAEAGPKAQMASLIAALGDAGAPSRRRTVALIELTSWGGGAETVALHVLRHLDRTRFAPVILTLWDARHHASKLPDIPCFWVDAFATDSASDVAPARDELEPARLDALRRSLASHRRAADGIRNVLAVLGPETAVITSMEHATVATWLAQIGAPHPYLAWIHTIESLYVPQIYPDPVIAERQAWALAGACNGARAVIAPVRYCADDLISAFGVKPSKVEVLTNPQRCAHVRRLSQLPDSEAYALRNETPFLFVHIGRFAPEKNHDLLVAAAGLLAARGRDFLLVCIGVGGDSERIAAEIAKLGLGQRIRLIGGRTNPFSVLVKADAMVLSSRLEGFGMVLAEAMVCGVPVVATDCVGGVREVLEGGRSGLLVAPDDPQALADGMERIMSDENLRRDLVREGYRRCEIMDITRVARRWEEIIDTCLPIGPCRSRQGTARAC